MGNCIVKKKLSKLPLDRFENIKLLNKKFLATVLDVYDGDTITLGFKINGGYWRSPMRLYGIDAPELNPKKEGRSIESISRERAAALKARGRVIELTKDKIVTVETYKQSDKYGRLLGVVYIDGKNLSEMLVEEKLVLRYYGKKKEEFDDIYKYLKKEE